MAKTIHITVDVTELVDFVIEELSTRFQAKSVLSQEEPRSDKFLTISQAAKLLNLAVPTVYGLVHRSEIPVYKRNNRLYFSEVLLINWVKAGRRQTTQEIKQDAGQSLYSKDEKSGS
jgi:excisionase family DNA binding protein